MNADYASKLRRVKIRYVQLEAEQILMAASGMIPVGFIPDLHMSEPGYIVGLDGSRRYFPTTKSTRSRFPTSGAYFTDSSLFKPP